ncbi:MAG: pantoate--beta-alanine ligase [Desulfobacterales bacterium]|nr:pantoate--beta-alanine ligase [Desulfobacterales bacterium]MBF0395734.1 pantoate--beta-alanine ligase [Desulfobacterales bacterium]
MEIISDIKKMREWSDNVRLKEQRIGFVPTMGFLHEGHLSLIREAQRYSEKVVLSIFVNPTQFGPSEDFSKYPRNLQRDLEMVEKENVNIVFTPGHEKLYPKGYQTYVQLESLPNHLCGISRPTHFRGVATIVTKLFNIVNPHIAVFGQKDYQQVAVIKQMVEDLNFDIKIIASPTIRESDGLAMSSRNTYLSPEQRLSSTSLYQSLKKTQALIKEGIKDVNTLIDNAKKIILNFSETSIDYIKICDIQTLEDMININQPVLMALAVKVGKTRLIDNMVLYP